MQECLTAEKTVNVMKRSSRAAPPPLDVVAPHLDQVLGYQLARASVLTSGVFSRAVGEPLGLRPVEYTILSLIGEQPGMTPARLARLLAVTAPNITAWLTKLEARALVERSTSAQDRRVQLLQLTAEGRRVARSATQRLVDNEAAALQTLSRGERLLLNELLCKVAALAGLESETGATDGDAQLHEPGA
jgi:DNA-binding MarR family transcriptional regulator